MKLFASLLVSTLVSASAFAANVQVVSIGTQDANAVRNWSSQCVSNIALKVDVKAQYRVGDEGKFKDIVIKKNHQVLFAQQFNRDSNPEKITVKFLTRSTDDSEKSYDLEGTVTRLRPKKCDNLENYEFQASVTEEGAIDLVHQEE